MKVQPSTPTNRRPLLATWARILLILAIALPQAFVGAVPVAHAASSVSLTATEDTYMSAAATTTYYGTSTTIEIDRNTSSSGRGAVLKWDLSSIPPYATITSASVTFNVTNTSTLAYNLYQMKRFWVEEMVNWQAYNGGNAWGTVGAANTTSDRYSTNLWNATTSSWSTTGSKTVTLNASGVAVLNGWISSPTSNYGFTIQDYSDPPPIT